MRIGILFFTLFSGISFAQETAEGILQQTLKKVNTITTCSYQLHYDIKYMNDTDTTRIDARCFLENRPDNPLGMRLNIRNQDEYQHVYNGKETYVLSHVDKKAIVVDSNEEEAVSFITGDAVASAVFQPFVHKDNTIKHMIESDRILSRQLDEVMLNDEPCYRIECEYATTPEIQRSIYILYVRKKDYLPVKITSYLDAEGMHQYTDCTLSDIKINEPQPPGIYDKSSIPASFSVEVYHPQPLKDLLDSDDTDTDDN